MPGVFDLQNPADLFAKLGRELARLENAPNDVDHAFNFFVTAEHMLDWRFPDPGGKSTRAAWRKREPLLQLVSHIASGAKHFEGLGDHHSSLIGSGLHHRHPNPMMRRMMPSQLCIAAGGEVAAMLGGARVTAISLAKTVYAFWQAAQNNSQERTRER
jgi:hypothetical protein